MITENEIAKNVFEAALLVHRKLGPGLLESAYQNCLIYELQRKGLIIEKEKPLPLIYNSIHLDIGYRIDIMVNNKFIIELKCVEALNEIHMAQILTYLRLSNCKLGMLINFNVKMLKHGVKRVINGFL